MNQPNPQHTRCERKGCPYCSVVTPERYRDERGDVDGWSYLSPFGYAEEKPRGSDL